MIKLDDLKYEPRDVGSIRAALEVIKRHIRTIEIYTGQKLELSVIQEEQPLPTPTVASPIKAPRKLKPEGKQK